MISFTVYGEPVAQGRPRAGTVNGKARLYDPKKSRDYKQYVKLVASEYRPKSLLKGPLELIVRIYKPSLKSFSKKKAAAAEQGLLRPTSKPDADNYVKAIKDGLNKVIWHDDSQVVDLHVSKFYSEIPRVEIQIKPLSQEEEQLCLSLI
ncbi:RusA family crossover junction endodeoxyribonuclease [Bacillus inaquosorum]|uniref:RusA family crossover junction endodeoxyribonuclease n=1 Tax=Bacillus inaquosorum TaxID=483913 RepID=UPI0022820B57|nr:RusA family crossover junction endodeoxyribonuclease [Bacillus inaquosorum]MCY8420264.1 RusA family crossover junction endodeoxyribonuclease [Bacillus inaquosorum]MEC0978977.1 RusA family crossover junction endodeoxyribonuclease [Bacillus inaquosorum]